MAAPPGLKDPAVSDLQCPICLEVLSAVTTATPCKHVFCRACLDQWVLENPSLPVCPMCRHPLAESGTALGAEPPSIVAPVSAALPGYPCSECMLDVLWDCADTIVLLLECACTIFRRVCAVAWVFYTVVYVGKAALALLLLEEPDASLVNWAPSHIHVLHVVVGGFVGLLSCCIHSCCVQ